MEELKELKCTACEVGMPALNSFEIEELKKQLGTDWKVVDNRLLYQIFPFENFKRGMAFAQEVALIAEHEDHHPEICIQYNSVEIELTTHAVNGLSENDFIMAAKIDQL